jgi:hypothetical protein
MIDTAEKRRSAAGVSWPLGPGVTPNVVHDAEWRRQVGFAYSFSATVPEESEYDIDGLATVQYVGQTPARTQLASVGQATVTLGSRAKRRVELTSTGLASSSLATKWQIRSELSSVASASVTFASDKVRQADFAISGTATPSLVSQSVAETDLVVVGAGAMTMFSTLTIGILSSEGEATTSLVGASRATSVLSVTGTAATSLASDKVRETELSSAGVGTVSLLTDIVNATELSASGEGQASFATKAIRRSELLVFASSSAAFEGFTPVKWCEGTSTATFTGQSVARTQLTSQGIASAQLMATDTVVPATLLDRGFTLLNRLGDVLAGESVQYTRGDATVSTSLAAILSAADIEALSDIESIVVGRRHVWRLDRNRMMLDGHRIRPERSDLIQWGHEGYTYTFEVLPYDGQFEEQASDPRNRWMRAATKLVSVEP